MKKTQNYQIAAGKKLSRQEVISIIHSAIRVDANRFARQVASHWLHSFSGDLPIELLQAQAMVRDERIDLAIPILKRICNTDPEYLPAQKLLDYAGLKVPFASISTTKANLLALGGQIDSIKNIPNWGMWLLEAKNKINSGQRDNAKGLIHKALTEEPDSPLAAVMHLRFARESYDWHALLNLAESYLKRWPDCLVCNLVMADTLMAGGQEERAVTLLHHAVSLDISGQVATRLWGKDHQYKDLWPRDPRIALPFPIPADVATAMGWNQLPRGEVTKSSAEYAASNERFEEGDHEGKQESSVSEDKTLRSIKSEFKNLAAKFRLPDISKADGRFPIYLVISSLDGLEKQYGSENLAEIDEAIKKVVKATQRLNGWDSCQVYVDDPASVEKFSLPPAKSDDPWSIKTLIGDIDKAMSKQGETVGAILIVGGEKVIPFHRLPNPVDDFDKDIPSDNPYACNDENYFVPSWSIGRLPGSASNDPTALIKQLEYITDKRSTISQNKSLLALFIEILLNLIPKSNQGNNIGYSAEVWRRAANSVFRPIGNPHTLMVSPPTVADEASKTHRKSTELAYYNLHGLENTAEWYGQRDPIETQVGPDYPVALRPIDIVNSGRAPQIVFSEACFGANIIKKEVDDAICLKFLASGTDAVVGSTCTSYGSITTPLIAADLLGKAFWSFVKDGFPAGEALRRAKIHLAKEMHKRQGYLDGEDQKTLISFVLYGDPLSQADIKGSQTKGSIRMPADTASVNAINDKAISSQNSEIPEEVMERVKSVVKEYLPGMAGAKVLFSVDKSTAQSNSKTNSPHVLGRKVVTLSKQIQTGQNTHNHYARITLDNEGKMVKLAISR